MENKTKEEKLKSIEEYIQVTQGRIEEVQPLLDELLAKKERWTDNFNKRVSKLDKKIQVILTHQNQFRDQISKAEQEIEEINREPVRAPSLFDVTPLSHIPDDLEDMSFSKEEIEKELDLES
jgi:chromosome segregation ATPase